MTPAKFKNCVFETYDALYKASVPSVSFYDLCKNCVTFEDQKRNIITLDNPITNEERIERNLKYSLDYYSYFIPDYIFAKILDEYILKYKLKGPVKSEFRTTICLGCGPTSSIKRWLEKHPEYKNEEIAANKIREVYPDFLTKDEKRERAEKQYL